MKNLLAIVIITFILISCSQPVKIIKYECTGEIEQGKEAKLTWEIENAKKISIKGVSDDLQPIGSITVKPDKTTLFTIIAEGSDGPINKECEVTVVPKPIEETKFEKLPDPIEKSTTKSKFLRGLISASDAGNSDFIYDIFSVDNTKYPDEIIFYVTVKDIYGNFIANLAPPYATEEIGKKFFIKLVEEVEGEKKDLSYFNVNEVHVSSKSKRSFSLVLDHSGSMVDNIKDLENSVNLFLTKKSSDDEISVVKYDHRIIEEVPLTNNLSIIRQKYNFDGLDRLGGWTAMLAAGDVGISSLNSASYPKTEILFTDGWENASINYFPNISFRPTMLINKARKNNTNIFTVGFGSADYEFLDLLSVLTGGKLFIANNGSEIEDIYSSFPRLFRNYYIVKYKPIKKEGMHFIALTGNNNNKGTITANAKHYIGDIRNLKLDDKIPPQIVTHFDFAKTKVNEYDIPLIKRVSTYLKENPESKIEIHGHADSKGSEQINLFISKNRANTVRSIFIKNGVSANRITVKPFGKSKLLYNPDDRPWQSFENRRVEVKII